MPKQTIGLHAWMIMANAPRDFQNSNAKTKFVIALNIPFMERRHIQFIEGDVVKPWAVKKNLRTKI